ncbi:MAG: hypothetical protein JWQ80_3473 [Massilia sp.]|nr:hypothetical protein [Massilia sp.]
MKKCLAAMLACAACATVAAQEARPSSEVRVTAAAERISLPQQLRNVWYDAFDEVAGEYALSNGGRMLLVMWGNRMYARIDGMEKVQLVAASPYVFIGLGRQVKIVVDEPQGSPDGRIHATVLLPAQMLSRTAEVGQFVQLLARR